MDKKRTVWDFMKHHSCFIEDLRVAANLLPKRKQAALRESLFKYANELSEYDPIYCGQWHNPFEKEEEE